MLLPLTLRADDDDDDDHDDDDDDDDEEDDHHGGDDTDVRNVVDNNALVYIDSHDDNHLVYSTASEFEQAMAEALKEQADHYIHEVLVNGKEEEYNCGSWWNPYAMQNVTSITGEDGEGAGPRENNAPVTDYSANTQEDSVDESDIIKADANFVYLAHDDNILHQLQIGPTTEAVADVCFEHHPRIESLLLTENHLIAIVNGGYYYINDRLWDDTYDRRCPTYVLASYGQTEIHVYEKNSAKGHLEFVASRTIHGQSLDARSIGENVHVETQSCLNLQVELFDRLSLGEQEAIFDETGYEEELLRMADETVIPELVGRLTRELSFTSSDATTWLPTIYEASPVAAQE